MVTITNVYKRTTKIATAFVIAFSSFAATSSLFLSQNTYAATDLVDNIKFSNTEQTLDQNEASQNFTIRSYNALNLPESLNTSSNILRLSSSSGGGTFSSNGTTNWSVSSSENLNWNNGWGARSFYYKDATAGTHTITATLVNGEDPNQTWETTQNITILDTEPPTKPQNTTPANGAQINTTEVNFGWQPAADNTSIDHYEFQSTTDINQTDPQGYFIVNAQRQISTTNSLNLPGYQNGTTYYWQVRAIDENNNIGAWSDIWSFAVDTILPVTEITTLPNQSVAFGGTLNNTVTAGGTVSDSSNNLSSYNFTVTSSTGKVFTSGEVPISASAVVQYSWNIKDEPSGNHTYNIVLSAKDTAGNTHYNTKTIILTIDNTAPTINILNDQLEKSGGSVQPEIDSDATVFTWTNNKDNPEKFTYDNSIKQPTFRPTAPGEYIFYVTACDDLGNCADKQIFTFNWRRAIIPIADPSIALPDVTSEPAAPATIFNTNNPETLGIKVTNHARTSSTKTLATNTETEPEVTAKQVSSSHAEAPSNNSWWILMILAILAAAYYAYRNWKLERD